MGRTSPEVDVFCKHLSYISGTDHLTIQSRYFRITLIWTCHLSKYPQDKDIEYREEHAKASAILRDFNKVFIILLFISLLLSGLLPKGNPAGAPRP